MPDFGSILTAMVTPFDDRGAIDEDATVALMHHLVANGSDGLVLSGTTGEASTLTDPEKIRLFELGVQELRGRATVVAGTGSNDTAHSVHLTEVAAALGVDAVLAVTPYYNRPPRAGLIGHFAAIAAVGVPVILYNIPSRAVVNLPPDLIAELAEIPGIVALKEANPDQVDEVLRHRGTRGLRGQRRPALRGRRRRAAPASSRSRRISWARRCRPCARPARAGDRAEAERLDAALHGLYEGLFTTTSPILIKAAVEMIGAIPSARMRLPLVEATPEERRALAAVLEAQDILVRAS